MLITTTLDTEPTWKTRADTRSAAHAYRQQEKKKLPRLKAWLRRITIVVLGALGIMLGGSTYASAAGMGGLAVWDYADDASAYIANFCGPLDVPGMSTYAGVETAFGLNEQIPAGSPARQTYLHNFFPEGEGGDGLNSAQKMEHFGFIDQSQDPAGARALTGVQGWANNPSFQRYGLNFDYFMYGNNCGSIHTMAFNMIARVTLVFVQAINLLGMLLIHYALDNVMYYFWGAIITPFVSVFGAIFLPFMLMAAVVGPVYIWFKGRGNMNRAGAAMIWVFCVLALTGAVTQRPAALMAFANNAVTVTASFAAQQMFNATNYTNQACNGGGDRQFDDEVSADPGSGISSSNPWQTAQTLVTPGNATMYAADQCILENLWYGVSYQTWINGQLSTNGRAQARYGPALLNSLYIGEDNADRLSGGNRGEGTQTGHNAAWNNAGYMPTGDGTKNHLWGAYDQWNKSNFLSIIGAMCGNGRLAGDADEGSKNPEENAWQYCQAGNKDTTDAADVEAFNAMTGADWRGRMIVATTGLFNGFVVLLTSGLVAIYLLFKKIGFYFLLLFLPIFMAIGVWPGSKGKRFFWKFWEMAFANLMQQSVAVILLLFISYLFAMVMAPSAMTGVQIPFNGNTTNSGDLPYLLKPFLCLAVLIGLITFAIPFRKMAKAAVAGNVDEFARYAKAGTYGKPVAKAAVVVGLAAVGGSAAAGAAKVAGGKAAASAAAGGASKLGAAKAGVKAGAKMLSESPAARKGAVKMLDTARRLDRAEGPMGKASALAHGFMGMQSTSREMREEVAQNTAKDIDAAKTGAAKKAAFNLGVEGVVQSDPERFKLDKVDKNGKEITYSRDGRDGTTAIPKTAWNNASGYLETELSETHPKVQTQRQVSEAADRANRIDAAHRELSERHHAVHGSYLPGSPQALEAQHIVDGEKVEQTRREASAVAFERAGQFASSSHYVTTGGELLATPISTVYQNLGVGNVMGDNLVPETDAQRAALIDNVGGYLNTIKAEPSLMDMNHPASRALLDSLAVPPTDPSAVTVARRAQDAVAEYGYPGFVESLGTTAPPTGWKNQTAAALLPRFEIDSWEDRVELGQSLKALAFSAPYNADVSDEEQLAAQINNMAGRVMNTTYGSAELNQDRERLLTTVFEYEGRFVADSPVSPPAPSQPSSSPFPPPPSYPQPSQPPAPNPPSTPDMSAIEEAVLKSTTDVSAIETAVANKSEKPSSSAPTPTPTPISRLGANGAKTPHNPPNAGSSSMVTGSGEPEGKGKGKGKGVRRPKRRRHRRDDEATPTDPTDTTGPENAEQSDPEAEPNVVTRPDDHQATQADSLFEGTRKRGLNWRAAAERDIAQSNGDAEDTPPTE